MALPKRRFFKGWLCPGALTAAYSAPNAAASGLGPTVGSLMHERPGRRSLARHLAALR
jgi:hypothetical protein